MDILMVAAELGPYARATATGDTVAALGKVLSQMGHDVTVALPRYPAFEAAGLLMARRLTPLDVDSKTQVTVLDGHLATGVKIVLFDVEDLYSREGIYGDPGGRAAYRDTAARFGLLCRAAAALCEQRREQGSPFEVVHTFDWPAAPVSYLLDRAEDHTEARVLTVHDASQQGSFAAREASSLGASSKDDSIKVDGRLNFLGLGLRHADAIVTTSPGYADDLPNAEQSGPLAERFGARRDDLTGVVGGLDYSVYNPATDPALRSRYGAEDASGKGSTKTELVRSLGLKLDTERPLVGAIVEDASAAQLLRAALPKLTKSELALVVTGSASAKVVDKAKERDPERIAVLEPMDDTAVRRLCAAADLLIDPRPYDSAAFYVRCAQRYGALPVACAAGAFRDAVVDCDADLETGTGFLFGEPTAADLVGATQRGLAAYRGPGWGALRQRVMRLDLSWDRGARRYLQIYRQARKARSR